MNPGSPLRDISDLRPLLEKIKDKKVVMLGESSHGTQEFYQWRRLISHELIKNYGFNFIAVEGDWPACEQINQFIQGQKDRSAERVLFSFSRWPTWMWANTEIAALMHELRELNGDLNRSVGFHGLDVYSLYESMDEVIEVLKKHDPELAQRAGELYACFEPYKHDERSYARSLYHQPEGCEQEVLNALSEILHSKMEDAGQYMDVVQNARIIQNAEKYYHTMISQEDDSWNVRDRHMMETLEMLFNHHGENSKAIIWAHNTHIGDYRATDMMSYGQINLGGLARERFGEEEVSLIGFTTYTGEVIASHAWDGPIQVMKVPKGKVGSLEWNLHHAINENSGSNYYLDFSQHASEASFQEYIGHRAIGVVYQPEHEHRGNYVPTIAAKRYDALIFIDQTTALTPLNVGFDRLKIPETYPYGSRI